MRQHCPIRASSRAGSSSPPRLQSLLSASAAPIHSAPSSNRCSAILAPRVARCRWCSRSPVFCISASGSSAVRSLIASVPAVLPSRACSSPASDLRPQARRAACRRSTRPTGWGVGLGVGCAYVPAIGAVQRWFVRRRGFASGQPQLHGPDPGERDGQHRRRGHCRRDLAGKGAGTDQALISYLTRFLYANRDPPRIKSGAGFRLKTL